MLLEKLQSFVPYNEQEKRDKEFMLSCLKTMDMVYTRENPIAHMTASAWIVNEDRTKVLMAYHKIYDSWAWLGGHADGETDLLKVSIKEGMEESGIQNLRPVKEEIFSIEVLPVNGHMKKGEYISSHIHLNVTYLLEASEREVLTIKEDENSGVAWFTPEEAQKASTEPWFVENIYSKLIQKMQRE
ncbi:MAG: NUDIX domain-containing protein [Lachnospiraceae bacterium]|nr:NUDIX domain-containing protein [Lachnospiraceae bacterium]